MNDLEKKADDLMTAFYKETFSMRVATKLAILSLTKTIEAFEDLRGKRRFRVPCLVRHIKKHQDIKEILEKRLAK